MKKSVEDNTLSNEELLRLYRETKDSYYLNRLYDQVQNLVYYLYNQNMNKLSCFNMSKEEIMSEINFAVARIIKSYSFDKQVMFSTALYKYISYQISQTYKKQKRRQREGFLDGIMVNISCRHDEETNIPISEQLQDTNVNVENSIIDNLFLAETSSDLKKALELLSETSRTVIISCYYEQKSIEDISKELHLAYNSVVRIRTKALKVLHEMITDPNYYKKQELKKTEKAYGSVKDIPSNYNDYLYLLTPKEKTVLRLRLEEKKMLKEISEELNLNSVHVGSILQAIAKKIKKASEGIKTKIKPIIFYSNLYEKYIEFIPELKELDQKILTMKYREQKRTSEIAKELGKEVSLTCSYIRNAEKRFEKLLIKKELITENV